MLIYADPQQYLSKVTFGNIRFGMAVSAKDAGPPKLHSPGRCPVPMWTNEPCDRPIHSAPEHDKEPVCLMHSRDPGKSDSEFQSQFEAILASAGTGPADFKSYVFPSAHYGRRQFAARCVFAFATFNQTADFEASVFTQEVTFAHAVFEQDADFGFAKFRQNAVFRAAEFAGEARFSRIRFEGSAIFTRARLPDVANFTYTEFLGTAEFDRTKFRQDSQLLPGPMFSWAEFTHPGSVVFYKTYLGQALFHNCDVSEVKFSSVEWRQRAGTGKRIVFEEKVDLASSSAGRLKPVQGNPDERDYRLIAEVYQQLKKNYDDRRDYWTAGDFHCGEMEMKRLHSDRANPLARWLHRNLGLVAWYGYASEYGESYVRPLECLVIALLLFTFLFPWPGLDWNESGSPRMAVKSAQQVYPLATASRLSYLRFSEFVDTYSGRKWLAGPAFFGHSLMTALSVAGFQKELKYEPSYPWGRALALLELLLTSTMIAIFLLAVRRQFRR